MSAKSPTHDAAHALVGALNAEAQRTATPLADRPGGARLRGAISHAFDAYAALRGVRVGDRVSVPGHVSPPRFGMGYGEVVKVNPKTATVRMFSDPSFAVALPHDADPASFQHDYRAVVADARAEAEGIEAPEPQLYDWLGPVGMDLVTTP